MNILLINGSPRGEKSNSLKLAKAFLKGFCEQHRTKGNNINLETVTVASLNIAACKGCFACWKNTPGVCCIQDDMQTVLQQIRNAHLVVWSFPLYYFSVPGILKNMIDRQLPLVLPFMSESTDGTSSGSHETRYDMSSTKHVLVSTCGFFSAEKNYDSVLTMFEHFLGKGKCETVFCGQGELFQVPELHARTDEYLNVVKTAGSEYALGSISESTKMNLKKLLYPKEVFERMADASWGISKTTDNQNQKEPKDLIFTRQMAALYNKSSYDGRVRVLEMHYTDTGSTYQIQLGKEESEVYTDGSLTATTRIETPFEVWLSISRGEITGSQALAKGMYTVQGDFSLMIHWDTFFGLASPSDDVSLKSNYTQDDNLKKPTMLTMLIPWMAFWIGLPINVTIGSLVALGLCTAMPFIMRKVQFTIWDRLSLFAVGLLSCFSHVTKNDNLAIPIGYLTFGLMWLTSCLTKEPLCAAYSKYDYGGDKAHANPLFMKTNRILAILWGTLYVLQAVWTYLLSNTHFAYLTVIVNSIIPCVMGIFTIWFVKWYPAWRAKRKIG